MSVLTISLIVAAAVLVLRFIIAAVRMVLTKKPINSILVVTIVLTSISAGMAAFLVTSIKSTIDERSLIEEREDAIIERLSLIREAQLVYQEVMGQYTSDWDSLITFIQKGEYPIIQRTEEIITLDYGADSVIVHIDTIDIVSARDRIFKATYLENARDSGVFLEYHVEMGDKAIKGTNAFSMRNSNGVRYDHEFHNAGRITYMTDLQRGDRIEKGDNLLSYWEYKFSPKVKIEDLAYVPGYEKSENVKFKIFADKVPVGKAEHMVDVIEVKNPRPFNPDRKESNEAKNYKPLRFGSRTDITTAGNWE